MQMSESEYRWCLEHLDQPKDGEVLRMLWVDGLSRKQIAEAMGLTIPRIGQINKKYKELLTAKEVADYRFEKMPGVREQRVLGISARLQNCIRNENLSLEDCLELTDEDMNRMPNLGRACRLELRRILDSLFPETADIESKVR